MPNIEIHGPFIPEYHVSVGGYRVPGVTLQPRPDDKWDVIVDHRFGLWSTVSFEELDNWMPVVAHAMAIAAGYSSHGEHSQRVNPYGCKIAGLGEMPPEKPKLEIIQNNP